MRDIWRLVVVLTVIAGGAGLVLSLVESITREPIAQQRRMEMLKALQAVLPPISNEPDKDTAVVEAGVDKKGLPVKRTFFKGRQDSDLVGVAFKVVAPDGYSGNIEIMLGVDPAGSVIGVEILTHAETPGLGDKIVLQGFRDSFRGKSLDNADWRVKKDGGEFDQFSGATISPRAVVGAVKGGLEFYRAHREQILRAGSDS